MCSIKIRYIVLIISVLVLVDKSGKLYFLLFNVVYPCFKTNIALVNGENYLHWFYYWMIFLGLRVVESCFESALLLITFGYYYYLKLFLCYLIVRQLNECEKIYGYFVDKVTKAISFAYKFNDSGWVISGKHD